MKLIAFILCLGSFVIGDNIDTFSWSSTEHDFGEITQNIPVATTYELTNNSDVPLVIEQVKVGCGCTKAEYTTEAIQPGASTLIETTFNAKKVGKFKKTATVTTNLSDEPTILSFEGVVVAD